MIVNRRTRIHYRIQHLVFVILLLACLGFAGWLSKEYDFRSDWTAGARHSLSKSTLELLSQLEGPVKLRTYQQDDATLGKAINEILERYQRNKPDFSYEIINPDIYIQQARNDNIERYGQTLIEYNGQQERINNLTEESVTNALMRLQRGNKPRLLFLGQHGERSMADTAGSGYALLSSQLQDKGFEIQTLNLLQQEIRPGNTVLVLSSINKPLLETEQAAISQYLEQGGNLLWLQDPGLEPSQRFLLDFLHLDFIPGVLVENNAQLSRMLNLGHPAMIPVLEYKMHPITQKMQYYTLFTTASAINPRNDDSDWITSDLLISSDTSWSETGGFDTQMTFNQGSDIPGPLSLGVALQRQKQESETLSAQRIVVIGDSDFISNSNLGQGANFDFVLKTLNWLAEDDSLIRIESKNAPDLQLQLSTTQAGSLAILFLFLLPSALAGLGIYIWLRRRKR